MTTPEDRDRGVFHFLHWAWKITEGHRLAATYLVRQADITVLAGLATLVTVDPARLDHVDLTHPLLVAPVPELGNLVIDGRHRIHRALRDQITHLPARQLTPADEQRSRIRPHPRDP